MTFHHLESSFYKYYAYKRQQDQGYIVPEKDEADYETATLELVFSFSLAHTPKRYRDSLSIEQLGKLAKCIFNYIFV